MPQVSVIVPNYNHAKYLKQRIESILAQSFQDFELIILDDCSTDNSREVIDVYRNNPRVSYIVFNEKNSGSPFNQWNKGMDLAQGEYVWIAESDDWADDNFLEVLMNEMQAAPNVVLSYTLARYVNEQGELIWQPIESEQITLYEGKEFIKNKLLYANIVYNVSMTLFKKKVFSAINHTVYEDMRLCGDWFFYTLLSAQGKILALNKIYSNYRVHTQNTSQAEERNGKTFLEGIRVLDYITANYSGLPLLKYSFYWAKTWVKYKRKYEFSQQVNRQIKRRMFARHKLIVIIYILYNVYYSIKNRR